MKYDKKRFKTPADYVKYVQSLSYDCMSLNELVGNDEGEKVNELQDFIIDDTMDVEQMVMDGMQKDYIMKNLKCLKPREEQVLRLRYGLDSDTPMTLEEIGQRYGVTRERIRQVEAEALKKLRTVLDDTR